MPPAPRPPAPLGRRILAAMLDLAFGVGILTIGLLREQATPFDGVFTFLGCLVGGASWLVRDTGGASPGKRLTGLSVMQADGKRVGMATSVQRNLVFGAALILSGAGTMLIADPLAETMATLSAGLGGLLGFAACIDGASLVFGEARRRFSDRWAGTQVVGPSPARQPR